MFNAPRRMGGQPLSSSSFLTSPGLSSSGYMDPLASSMPAPAAAGFGDMDPWSAVPSPARSGTPRGSIEEIREGITAGGAGNGATTGREGLNGLINDPPAVYVSLLDQLNPSGTGHISLASVHRLLATSKLPALTVEKIINLTSRDRSSLARQEFFCALALVALAQSSPENDDISIERLSASLPNLPLPDLKPSAASINSTLSLPSQSNAPAGYDLNPDSHAHTPSTSTGFNGWDTTPRTNGFSEPSNDVHVSSGYSANGSAFRSDGILDESQQGYWKRLETVEVVLIAEKEGWFLQKYKVESDKRASGSVSRRYSDFVWLLDCLIKRYPFRLLPGLPPKRIGPDASFLESRRKALRRFINFVVNHPVMKDDGALNVFLTEPNFEAWRKRTKVSTDEESMSKKLNPAQEMAIPADLEEKLGNLRDHLPTIMGSYQKLVVLAERGLARLQAQMGDASRMALGIQSVGETVGKCCFRCVPGGNGEGCSLCEGVGRGLGEVGESWTRVAEETEKRAIMVTRHIEALKTQRDLYLSFRDLFVRHDKLSKDSVDALRKKVETRSKKIDGLKSAAKPGWEAEVDKLVAATDQDNSTIASLLSRRVFIRACMWHELSVVHHSRQAAQVTLGWREFTRDQVDAMGRLRDVWDHLGERLQGMPVE
ncbi:sorting nexin MVP1 [Kwoniella heveanensis BCC8398]|uniref:Sorting nexin MVP1 n=1 Tax=Kwoniella heveanensis BCC8398 TaxID=1296120 RepID=A0A1B9GJV4_9TREE|nr:sorting nexin MVP1 [Kwoniella heveanensis BCC8398]